MEEDLFLRKGTSENDFLKTRTSKIKGSAPTNIVHIPSNGYENGLTHLGTWHPQTSCNYSIILSMS